MVRLCSSKIARVMARSMKKNLTNLFLQILVFWQIYFFMLLAISLAIFELQRRTIPHFNPLNNSFWPYKEPFCCRVNSFWVLRPNVSPIFFEPYFIAKKALSATRFEPTIIRLLDGCLNLHGYQASINSNMQIDRFGIKFNFMAANSNTGYHSVKDQYWKENIY